MPHTCSRFVIVALTVLVASGCATPESEAPKPEPAVSAAALNLPDPLTADDCNCDELAVVEENYFDRGVRAEVMILALAAVQTLEGRLEALDALNQAISQDLEKREEALKRLRDLTLGQ